MKRAPPPHTHTRTQNGEKKKYFTCKKIEQNENCFTLVRKISCGHIRSKRDTNDVHMYIFSLPLLPRHRRRGIWGGVRHICPKSPLLSHHPRAQPSIIYNYAPYNYALPHVVRPPDLRRGGQRRYTTTQQEIYIGNKKKKETKNEKVKRICIFLYTKIYYYYCYLAFSKNSSTRK